MASKALLAVTLWLCVETRAATVGKETPFQEPRWIVGVGVAAVERRGMPGGLGDSINSESLGVGELEGAQHLVFFPFLMGKLRLQRALAQVCSHFAALRPGPLLERVLYTPSDAGGRRNGPVPPGESWWPDAVQLRGSPCPKVHGALGLPLWQSGTGLSPLSTSGSNAGARPFIVGAEVRRGGKFSFFFGAGPPVS